MINLKQLQQEQIVIFSLDEPHYALRLSAVERVVRAVEITPMPKPPQSVLGVINVQGQVIPVVNIRQRLGLPPREIKPDNLFILARTSRRLVALVADSVKGTQKLTEQQLVPIEQVLPGAEYIHGMAKLNDGLILICDLDQFLSFDDERKLEAALSGEAPKMVRQPGQKKGAVA